MMRIGDFEGEEFGRLGIHIYPTCNRVGIPCWQSGFMIFVVGIFDPGGSETGSLPLFPLPLSPHMDRLSFLTLIVVLVFLCM